MMQVGSLDIMMNIISVSIFYRFCCQTHNVDVKRALQVQYTLDLLQALGYRTSLLKDIVVGFNGH